MGAPPVVAISRAWARRQWALARPADTGASGLERHEPRAARSMRRRGLSGPPLRRPTRCVDRPRGRRSPPAGGVPVPPRRPGQPVPQSQPEEAHRDLTRRTRVAGAKQPNPGSPFRPGGGGKGRGDRGGSEVPATTRPLRRYPPRTSYTPSFRCKGDSSAMKTKLGASGCRLVSVTGSKPGAQQVSAGASVKRCPATSTRALPSIR